MLSLNNVDRSHPKGHCILPFILGFNMFSQNGCYLSQTERGQQVSPRRNQTKASRRIPVHNLGCIVFAHMVKLKTREDTFAYERDVNIALMTNNAKSNCKLGLSTQSSRCFSTKVPPPATDAFFYFLVFWSKVPMNFCHRCKERPSHFPKWNDPSEH